MQENRQIEFAIIKKNWQAILLQSIASGFIFVLALDLSIIESFVAGFCLYAILYIYLKVKNIFTFFRRFLKKLGVAPIIGIMAYALWCLILFIYTEQLDSGSKFIDQTIRSFGTPSKFIQAYAPSAFDSLIFFIFIGGILTINSMKQPEDEKLSRKVEQIFPTVPTESKLSNFLIDKVSELACINKITEQIITIEDYSQDDEHIKLSIKSHSVIKNIHNNHPYSSSELPWAFSVESVKPNTDILGEIHEISIIRNISGSSEEKHILNGIETLTPSTKEFSTKYPLEIKEEKEVLYQTNAWAWEHIKKKWTFNSSRYTELRTIKFINKTDFIFQISSNISNRAKVDSYTVSKEQIKTITYKEILPSEKISLSISNLSSNTEGETFSTAKTNHKEKDSKKSKNIKAIE